MRNAKAGEKYSIFNFVRVEGRTLEEPPQKFSYTVNPYAKGPKGREATLTVNNVTENGVQVTFSKLSFDVFLPWDQAELLIADKISESEEEE